MRGGKSMPLTLGTVILVLGIILILGQGNFFRGFVRFWKAQLILLVVYLLISTWACTRALLH